MRYKYHSRRAAKRLASKSRRNFIITLIIIAILIYSTITWVLPSFIGGLGFIKNIVSPPKKTVIRSSENANLAPPVLNIPYEATYSARINIAGFSTPDTKVKLYLDDEDKQTIDVLSDGSFTFEDISLSLGTNNIYGTTLDNENKQSLPSKTIKLIYDNEKPILSINEPEDNKKIQGGDKKVKISGTIEPGAKVYINSAQIIVGKEGNFSTDQPVNDGDNDIIIKAVDIALNSTEIQRRVNYAP
ncbi:MAG: hypothetical protein Q7R77_00900 [Candidatus Daviesbacteria bacterium]|nr:hypothetical protein [Candidatus Daviesbacteria bacterium]